jgi:hypothetical protein
MNLDAIIKEHGLFGLMIVGMAIALRMIWNEYTAAQTARIADMKEANKDIAQVASDAARAIDALTEAVKASGK